jgi:hypothetical protein
MIHGRNGQPSFDYLDKNQAITTAMFRRRVAGYRELGYVVEMPDEANPVWFAE